MADDGDPTGTGRTHYLDFELEIGPGSEQTYAVSVIRSPAGEARETMHFPFDKLALERHLKDLQIALLRSGGARRQLLAPEEQAVQTFGRELFDALISGETRSRYDLSSREARQQGVGLRLKLRIKPPELAALPWEFLYDPRQAEYICLSRDTPVIRYLELPHPIQPLVVRPPLSILGMIASPRDLSPLDIGREKRRMERAVQALQSQELVNLTWLEGQTWRDLQRAMRGGPWHIFHFIGHGGFDHTTDEGLIALADSEGMTRSFRATELGRLLADHRSLRLVLLNSCEGARASERDIFSSTASILVRRGLPAVLAMQYEITDPAAIEFARAFYEALADGLPVDAAVTEARKAVSLAVTNSVEWGIPVVYMRAPQGVIFQLPETDRVRGRPPGPPTFLDEEQEARLDQLYTEGLSAFWVEDWDRACRNFQAILDEYPGYPNATAKLEEARLQRKLNTLYAEAGTAEEAGDWAAALSALERLVSEAPDFKDAAILLETARGQKQLADLYEEVRRLYQAEQWQAVVNVFAQIQALDPGYGDPEGLLAGAGREVAALKRRAELDQLYRRAIVELDAGHWSEAQRLLASLEAQEPGFRETKRLLERAETELAREEAAQRREEQLASLYEQALGLARAGQWRGALAKLEEVHKLDPQHPDPEGIAAQAQEEIAGEEAEAQRQSELAALYAEAVQLLQSEQYQAALEKWGEVQAQDPRYPDRQKVQATARKRLNELAKAGAPRRQLPGWAMAALGLLGVVVLVAIGALLITGGGTTTPEPGASQVPGVAVKATDTPTLLPPAPEPAATEDLTPAAEEPAGATASLTDTSQPCQAASEWVEIESPWLANEVTFDGKITTAEEWSDALCLDATLAEPIWNDDEFSWGDSISSKWWIKSDAQRIFLLARVPVAEFEAYGAAIHFAWDEWESKDQGEVNQDGGINDNYGWDLDADRMYRDEEASPPGANDVQGAASQDGTYYWFEFAKDLDSGDGYDWAWAVGETIADAYGEVMLLGIWGEGPLNWFEIHVEMHLADGQSPTAAQAEFPSPVSEAVSNADVLYHDDFDRLSPSQWDYNNVEASDSLLEITGEPNFETWLNCRTDLREGEGVLTLFKPDAGSAFVIYVRSGMWQGPEYRRWGIYFDSDSGILDVDIYRGDSWSGGDFLSGDPALSLDTWYYLLLAVGEGGEFLTRVWERDNPSQISEYRHQFEEDWAGRDWRYAIQGRAGKIYVDSFTHIAFSDITTAQAEPGASQVPGVAVNATDTPIPTSTLRPTAAPTRTLEPTQLPTATVSPVKPYKGVDINLLTADMDFLVEPLQRRAPDFEAQTGARVNVTGAPFEDLYKRALADVATEAKNFDVYVLAPIWIADLVATGYLEDLSDRVAVDEALQWDDIVPFFRDFNAVYGGRIYAIPLDGDLHLAYYRADLLQQQGLEPPETWEEYLNIAQTFHGKDLDGDGEADYGSCIARNDRFFAPNMIWSIASAFLQSQGSSQGVFFDTENMKPLVINKAFASALDILIETSRYGPPHELYIGDTRDLFLSGRCALTVDWTDLPVFAISSAVQDKMGAVILPGSARVLDRASGELVDCNAGVCPYAVNGVNHAPYAAWGGWSGVVNAGANPVVKNAAYAFLSYMSQPAQANVDVTRGDNGFNPYRSSQLRDEGPWLASGMSPIAVSNYLGATEQSLSSPNIVADLRVPGSERYRQLVFDRALSPFLAGEITRDEAMQRIYDGWEEITEELGRDSQLEAYRDSLNITQ